LQSDQKLLIVITSDDDAEKLIEKLLGRGYPATKVSSTGGFLRRGSATILSGIEAAEIDTVMEIIRTECKARVEMAPALAMPLPGIYPTPPTELRVGGAIIFVLPVERFEKT